MARILSLVSGRNGLSRAVRAMLIGAATAAAVGSVDSKVRAEGLTATGAQFFHQDVSGVGGTAEQFDAFGAVLASGDVNGDGFGDVAVGVPGEDGEGRVQLLFGGASGMSSDSSTGFGYSGATNLGRAIVLGDFDGNGSDEVAFGLTWGGEEWISIWTYLGSGIWDDAPVKASDFPLGVTLQWNNAVLAAGDLNGDQYDDLAVHAQNATSDRIQMVFGSNAGITSSSSSSSFTFGSPSATNPTALALGDFDANVRDDIVLGFANATVNAQAQAGETRLFFNGSATGSETWHQDSAGIVGGSEAGDRFGYSLATGDMTGDSWDDLFVGVPFETAALTEMGAFQAINGDGSGLTSTGNQLHNSAGNDEAFAHYGSSLAAGNFDDGDFAVEVAGGAPQGSATIFNSDAGTVSTRFSNATVNYWHQDVAGVPDAVEGNDAFGDALAAGDFNGDGADDLAIGAPGETIGAVGEFCGCHGAVHILYGTPQVILESASADIGPAGGTIGTGTSDPVEVTLTVPPGALPSTTTITIEAYATDDVTPPPGGGNDLSRSYKFSPAGLTFATPATLQINYSDAEVAGMDEASLGVWLYSSSTGQWEPATVVTRNLPFNYLIVEIPHFSTVVVRDLSASDFDTDGCSDGREVQAAIGSETSGGRRDATNPYDYMNPTDDGFNRIDDVLAVVGQYFDDDTDGNPGLPPYTPGYDPDTDRTDDPGSSEAWDLLIGNGQQRIDDILAMIKQYFHDCS